ncbi:MAG: hypothetical protein Q8Q20_01020 [bacterium]|nr:hypothetical protein [bacterium]
MRRKKSLFRRLIAVLLGLVGVVTGMLFSPRLSSIVAEYQEAQTLRKDIRDLNPQSLDEFWPDLYLSMDWDTERWSRFNPEVQEMIELLSRDSSGHKTWATEELRNRSYWQAMHDIRWGYIRYRVDPDERSWLAYTAKKSELLFEAVVCFLLGGGAGVAGLLFLPYITVLLLTGLFLLGKGGSAWISNVPQETPPIVQAISDAEHDANDCGPAILPTVIGLVALVVLWLIRSRETTKQQMLLVTRGRARAPPLSERRFLVKFMLSFLFLVMALPVQAADSIYLQFGEWQNTGAPYSGVTWSHQHGWWTSKAFTFLDGSVQELLWLPHFKLGRFDSSPGLALGVLPDEVGLHSYYGYDWRSSYTWGDTVKPNLSSSALWLRITSRQTSDDLLNHLGIVGIQRHWRHFSLKASYQPIYRNGAWEHRPALSVSLPQRHFTIHLEVRRTVDPFWKTSGNVDVEIPLSR